MHTDTLNMQLQDPMGSIDIGNITEDNVGPGPGKT